jgi:hypothetical protein
VPTLPRSGVPADWSSRLRPSYDPITSLASAPGRPAVRRRPKTHHTKPSLAPLNRPSAQDQSHKTSRRLAAVDHACRVPPPTPPAARPYKGRPEADSFPGGGTPRGHPSPQPQGSPEVSPRTPHPSPSRPGPTLPALLPHPPPGNTTPAQARSLNAGPQPRHGRPRITGSGCGPSPTHQANCARSAAVVRPGRGFGRSWLRLRRRWRPGGRTRRCRTSNEGRGERNAQAIARAQINGRACLKELRTHRVCRHGAR